MPTSSQAMILRCGESPQRRLFHTRASSSAGVNDTTVHFVNTRTTGSCGELVKFDFSVSATPDNNLNGFEGVFAYDETTKSYRWQIFAVNPKRRGKVGKQAERCTQDGGDFSNDINEDNLPNLSFEEHESKLESNRSFIEGSPSEHTRHFTTPEVSRLDNTTCAVNLATGVAGQSPRLSSLNIPPDTDNLDTKCYRRLEELGFRRQTTYSPSGALVRIRPKKTSPPRSPRGCRSEMIKTTERVSQLCINNLNPPVSANQIKVPFKGQAFHPNSVIKGEPMRKRVPATKQKSLLEEVKESVKWEERSTQPLPFRRGRPRSVPTAVCFSKEDAGEYSHQHILDMVRQQIDENVTHIQFDPTSVRTPEFSREDRWVVTFNGRDGWEKAIERGIALGGELLPVRAFDDVMKDEYIPDDVACDFPRNFRLQSEKHKYILRNFLNNHKQAITA